MELMFKKNRWLGRRALIFILLSIVLMIFDARSSFFHRHRVNSTIIVSPIEYVVNEPLLFFHHVFNSLVTREALLEENAHLRSQNILLQSKLQHFMVLQQENSQLHTLLASSSQLIHKVLEAQILSIEPNLFMQQFIVNRGVQDGVFMGQAVLDAYGVVGQIIEVQP
jgi:rod shape-determining protein MreC